MSSHKGRWIYGSIEDTTQAARQNPCQWARPWNGPSETHRCSPSSHFCKMSSCNQPRSSCHPFLVPGSLERKKYPGRMSLGTTFPAKHGIGRVEGIAPIFPRFGVHHPSESACSRGSDWGTHRTNLGNDSKLFQHIEWISTHNSVEQQFELKSIGTGCSFQF